MFWAVFLKNKAILYVKGWGRALLLSPPVSRCWKPAGSCRSWLTGADSLWYAKCVKSPQAMGKTHWAEEFGVWGLCGKLPRRTNFGWKWMFRYFFVIIKMPNPRNPLARKYYMLDPQLMCSGRFIIWSLWQLGIWGCWVEEDSFSAS